MPAKLDARNERIARMDSQLQKMEVSVGKTEATDWQIQKKKSLQRCTRTSLRKRPQWKILEH
jgi:hypothetical protein